MDVADSTRWLGRALLLGLLGLTAPAARADLMVYRYGGVVTSASADAPAEVGARFSGTFAYDPTEQPSVTDPGGIGHYGNFNFDHPGKTDSDVFAANSDRAPGWSQPLYQQSGRLDIGTSQGGPGPKSADVSVYASDLGSSANYARVATSVAGLMFSGGDSALYPASGPPPSIRLSDFTSATFFLDSSLPWNPFQGSISYGIAGTVDELTLITPAATWLGVLGGLSLIWRKRPRRHA